jgi:conjugal transfer pilus assembly protein TraF
MKQLISILAIIFISNSAYAFKFTPEVCAKYGLGKNWYCEEAEEEARDITANDILNSELPGEEKAIRLNALWETQIKRATITENVRDIKKFLDTHNLITSKGIQFAKNVQKIIETNPLLFNSESYYKNVVEEQIRDEENKEILQNASSRYGLVFVYSTSCPHCVRQLSIILRFRDEYGFKILGITTDDSYFEGLDENIIDPTITNDLLVQSFPTILLLDKKVPGKIFLTKGIATNDELEEKIVKRIKEREDVNEESH